MKNEKAQAGRDYNGFTRTKSLTVALLALASLAAVPLVFASIGSLTLACPAALSKDQKPISESIEIKAPESAVFDAIRAQRNNEKSHRKQILAEGDIYRIDEKMEGVAIYGKVHCIWEEKEIPPHRIDYKMVESDKFKSGFGSWIMTPSADGKSTTLEFQSFMDTGLKVPFAGEITKMAAHGDAKARLERIKKLAEAAASK
ncbi:MAG: SRPBCC family protein [Cyanobacteria bacterium REEB67]|nr:SRPBCC family protein [Cyanobacteria bacterium REEB67]